VPLLYVLAEQPQPLRGFDALPAAMTDHGPLTPLIQATQAVWRNLQPWPLVQDILWLRCWKHESWEAMSQQLGIEKPRLVQQAYHDAITQLTMALNGEKA